MTSLAYNIGLDAFRASTLLRLYNAGNTAGAAAQFDRWSRANGRVLRGLVARREAERAVFEGHQQA
jgi:lysozyme